MIRFIFLTFTIFSILFSKEPINQSQIVVKNNRDHCPEGYIDDCLTQNGCAELNWLGDGWCDDGTWGAYLECYMYSLIEGEIIGGPGQIVDSPDNGDCGTDNCANNGLDSNSEGLCTNEQEEIDYEQEDGEVVKDIMVTQRTDGSGIVDVSYNLEPHSVYPAYYISISGFAFNNKCWGDLHYNVLPGENKQIHCKLSDDTSTTTQINIKAQAIYIEEVPESIEMVTIPYVNDNYIVNSSSNSGGFVGAHFDYGSMALINNSYLDMENYQYEMMTHEVTVLQYVNFLNQIMDSAIEVVTITIDDTFFGEHPDYGYICYATRYILDDSGRYLEIGSAYCNNDDSNDEYYISMNGFLIPSFFDEEISGCGEFSQNQEKHCLIAGIQNSFLEEYSENDLKISLLEYPDSFGIAPGFANYPITLIREAGAQAFAQFYGMRIPYAYEWANAAGSPADNEGNILWQNEFPLQSIINVGNFSPNSNGLYDMLGNVGELVINNTYTWNDMTDYYWFIVISTMGGHYNANSNTHLFELGAQWDAGFRCVRTLQSSSE